MGYIQGVVMLIIIVTGCYDKDFAKSLTRKKIIVIGPQMKISISVLSIIEISRLSTKAILAYHDKQLRMIESRKKAFIDSNQLELLKS